jgi:hypothetical protein
MGFKTFVNGDILDASEVNDFLMKQSVMVFADAAARTTALPSPIEGMVTYLSDTDSLEVYTGAAFVIVNDNTAAILKSIIDAKGDLIAGTAANTPDRLAVGTNEHRLIADSSTSTGLAYVADTTNFAVAAKGDLLAGTAADTLEALTVGTNGHVLTADSTASTGLAWAPSASSGRLIKLATVSPSSDSTATIDNVFSSTYRDYLVTFRLIGSVADGLKFRFRTSGSDNTTSNYTHQQMVLANTTFSNQRVTNANFMQFAAEGNADPSAGVLWIFNPQQSTNSQIASQAATSFVANEVQIQIYTGHFNDTTVFDGIKFFPNSGNFTGVIDIYGLEN